MSWYNTSYLYKKQITIDHTKVSGGSNLSSFPMLLSLTDANLATVANGGYVQNSNGYDIIFTDSTETTQLFHEIESYTASNGTLVFWIKIPTLSSSSDTIIYMYFDNSSISTFQSTASSVWDSNYKAIYHMNDNAANTTVKDSTSNAKNGTNAANTSTKTATGKIGSALTFNGSSDYVNDNVLASSIASGNVTVSFWFKLTSTFNTSASSGQNPFGLSDSPSTNDVRFELNKTDGKLYFEIGMSTGLVNATSTETSWTGGTWYCACGVFSSTTGMNLYVNGASDGSNANTSRGTTSAAECDIGRTWDPIYFNGVLDEFRISNIARSAGWITTEYNNQNSPSTFFTVGSLTSRPLVGMGFLYSDSFSTISPGGGIFGS